MATQKDLEAARVVAKLVVHNLMRKKMNGQRLTKVEKGTLKNLDQWLKDGAPMPDQCKE